MKKFVRIKIIIKSTEDEIDFSYFDIRDNSGDIYYRTIPNPIYDHISFHCDGNVLITTKQKGVTNKHITPKPEVQRLEIKELGQIHLLTDFIKTPKELSISNIKPVSVVDHDIILNIDNLNASLFLRLDLLSGENIVSKDYEKIPKEDHEGKHLVTELCAMGKKSGQADKIILINLFQDKREIEIEREVFIPSTKGNRRS